MKIRRTSTPKKKEANRLNYANSTGPKSERGKRTSSMNALKFGFYSTRVVIPELDGEDALERYQDLRSDLYQEYDPVGPSEMSFADLMTEAVWRRRRVLLAERGACLLAPWDLSAWSKDGGPMGTLITFQESVQRSLQLLDAATVEIERTGSLSETSYASLGELIGDELQSPGKPTESESAQGKPVVDDSFRQRLEATRLSLRSRLATLDTQLVQGLEHHMSRWAVPSSGDVDRISRYERRMQNQFEWAQRMLFESQKRRKRN